MNFGCFLFALLIIKALGQPCCRTALEPGRCSVEKCPQGRRPVCCGGYEWVCLASDEGCDEARKCLDIFPGTCPISLTALVVFVVGTAGCVMVIIIFFTRTHHPLDNKVVINISDDIENDLVDNANNDDDDGEILLVDKNTDINSKSYLRRQSTIGKDKENDILNFEDGDL